MRAIKSQYLRANLPLKKMYMFKKKLLPSCRLFAAANGQVMAKKYWDGQMQDYVQFYLQVMKRKCVAVSVKRQRMQFEISQN